jgi:hypothetical protein
VLNSEANDNIDTRSADAEGLDAAGVHEANWCAQRDELAPFQLLELHSVPASEVGLQDIELAMVSQEPAKTSRSASAPGRSMLSRHAGGGQRGAWHVVLAARGADRKTAADGMRAVIDESGGAVGWRATSSASWPQQLDLAIAG